MSSPSSSSSRATRHALNIKVLRRHDSSITRIVADASFVVLYRHDGASWTKTGIEGPMFLFHRSRSPSHGFFLLNRNGVDNFVAPLTQDDDLDLTDQFIIYRRATAVGEEQREQHEDGTVGGEQGGIYGIWIFEEEQRTSFGEEMVRLQSAQEAPVAAAAPPSTPPPPTNNGLSLLDSIFQSAAAAASASPPPPPPPAPTTPTLDALFASARIAPSPILHHHLPHPYPHPPPPPPLHFLPPHLAATALDDSSAAAAAAGRAAHSGPPLDKADFVRGLLGLIHTNPAFVDDVYSRYVRRLAGNNGALGGPPPSGPVR